MANTEVHEERPKAQAAKQLKGSPLERILVQVTQNDINAGQDKSVSMQREGWIKASDADIAADPTLKTGVNGYFYMQKPKAAIEADRKQKTDRWKALMRAPLAQGLPGGIAARAVDVGTDDVLSAAETQSLDALATLANS